MMNPSVIKLTLPKSEYQQTIRKTEISISITKELNYFINKKPVQFSNLEKELLSSVKDINNTTVVIRCDNSIPVQELVNVLQIGIKLKIKMILATKAPNA